MRLMLTFGGPEAAAQCSGSVHRCALAGRLATWGNRAFQLCSGDNARVPRPGVLLPVEARLGDARALAEAVLSLAHMVEHSLDIVPEFTICYGPVHLVIRFIVVDADIVRHQSNSSVCELNVIKATVSNMMTIDAAPGTWCFNGICGIRVPIDAAHARDVDAAEDLEPN